MSPMGEALTKLPASVAMFRIGVDETSFRCVYRSGKIDCITVDSSKSVTVADAPISIKSPLSVMLRSESS